MGRKHSAPRRGSLAFRPRGRHGTLNARIRNWPTVKSDEPTYLVLWVSKLVLLMS